MSNKLDDLFTQAIHAAKEKAAIERTLRDLTDAINKIRDSEAASIAAEQLKITRGVYIREPFSSSKILRVDSIAADRLSENLVGSTTTLKEARRLKTSQFRATCTRIHAGSGLPMKKRGHGYGNDVRYETETIRIDGRTIIIPESEINAMRKRMKKSDAVKRLSSLSEPELQALLKKAGKL